MAGGLDTRGGDATVSGVRPEIQALRAVAVLAVVAYHLWPHVVRGGFVGVDVFFAISGFLITSHLLREVDRTGRVSIAGFWARRIRRLLPASLLVLAVSAIVTALIVPASHWTQFYREIAGSAAYVQNWLLSADAVDYLAADNSASPVQHYWSLSAEEQFYVVWPLLLVLALVIARVRRWPRRRVIAIVLTVVTVGSLLVSVVWTARYPASAYFVTPTRAWEFGAGGLLALLAVASVSRLRVAAAWAGWALIAVSIVFYSGALPFPSFTAALPVAGTLLVIWGGAPASRWSPTFLVSLRPVRIVGDLSYSLYLWHWPLIVFAGFAFGRSSVVIDLGIIVVAFALSWLTKKFIEDPARLRSPLVRARPRFTFVAMLVAVVLVAAGAGVGWANPQIRIAQADALVLAAESAPPACFGAAAMSGTCTPLVSATILPDPLGGARPLTCASTLEQAELVPCVRQPAGQSAGEVAVIGDSHADALVPAVLAAFTDDTVHQLSKESCPLTTAHRTDGASRPRAEMDRINESCDAWNVSVDAYLGQHPGIRTIFLSASSLNKFYAAKGLSRFATAEAGYRAAFAKVPSSVTNIIVIRDVPRPRADFAECADAHRADPNASCSRSLKRSLLKDPLAQAARDAGDPRVHLVELTRYFCGAVTCPAVIGDVLVYRDGQHVTPLYAQTLAPYLAAAVAPLLTH